MNKAAERLSEVEYKEYEKFMEVSLSSNDQLPYLDSMRIDLIKKGKIQGWGSQVELASDEYG